jgi:hypothetical protein
VGEPCPRPSAVVVLDDDEDDYAPGSMAIDRSFSDKVARDRAAAERADAAFRALHPEIGAGVGAGGSGVGDRIDAMQQQAEADAAAALQGEGMDMDIVSEQLSQEEQIDSRLREVESARIAEAVAFLRSSRASEKVVLEKYNIPMTEANLKCLTPVTWLNDEVINFYMSMLQDKDSLMCAKQPNRVSSHYFNSFFISKLLENRTYTYKNVKR